MDATELDQRLQELGFTVKLGTLRSWAAQGIITGPERYFEDKPEGQGRYVGRRADWPEETVEDVAAYLKVKEWQLLQPRKRGTKLVPLMPLIPKIRKFAEEWYESPFEATGLKGMVSDDLRAYLAGIGVHCYVMHIEFPFLMIWLQTVEKVRRNWPLDKPASVLFIWDIPPEIYKPAVTLEEALQMQLPAKRPTVHVFNSESGEDDFLQRGKMWVTESAEFIKLANR